MWFIHFTLLGQRAQYGEVERDSGSKFRISNIVNEMVMFVNRIVGNKVNF